MQITPAILESMGATKVMHHGYLLKVAGRKFWFMREPNEQVWHFKSEGKSIHPVTSFPEVLVAVFENGCEAGKIAAKKAFREITGSRSR